MLKNSVNVSVRHIAALFFYAVVVVSGWETKLKKACKILNLKPHTCGEQKQTVYGPGKLLRVF